jgi:hypothetical protein
MGRRYPKTVYPLVDQDYLARLSPEERAWLDRFNGEFYNAEFGAAPLHEDEEVQRGLNAHKQRRLQDLYAYGLQVVSDPTDLGAAEHPDGPEHWIPEPAYLKTAEYRAALAEFRAQLATDGRRNPEPTPEYIAAVQKIDTWALNTRGGRELGATHMARNRIAKLQEHRQIYWNIGVLLSQAKFKGSEAVAIAQIFPFLEAALVKLDGKLKALGVEAPQPPNAQSPAGGK